MVTTLERRKNLAYQYLSGKGLEFGALNNPLCFNTDKCSVVYADKYPKNKLLKNFPELQSQKDIVVDTDIFVDLNKGNFDNLAAYNSLHYNFDFYIANHVLEHLVNPLKFLEQLYLLMKPGAILYLAIPNKKFTFDSKRQLTTWHHLYDEYQRNETRLSNAHLEDFILNITKDHINDSIRQKKLYDDYQHWYKRFWLRYIHRRRSIHVHVWDDVSFKSFIFQAIEILELKFQVLNNIDGNNENIELIYILQKI